MVLKTDEERLVSEIGEARKLINELEGTISYEEIKKNEVLAGEIVDCRIIRDCYEKAPIPSIEFEVGFPKLESGKSFKITKASDEQVEEAMSATRLALGTPGETTLEARPLAINALSSLISQAIGGKSSLMCQTEDKAVAHQMNTSKKAAIINEMMALRNDSCKLYECDGMVRYVAGSDYVYLPISELLDAFEAGLRKDFPNAEYTGGTISHQIVQFNFILNDELFKRRVENILSQAGITEAYEPAVIFMTSNTGDCGANIIPVLHHKTKGNIIIEEPLKLEHRGKASIEEFSKNVEKIAAIMKATPEKIEALADVLINHPAKAYRNVAVKAGLPVSCFVEQASCFEATYGNMATAIDLYFDLIDQLEIHSAKSNIGIIRKTKLLNGLAKVFLSLDNLKDCDVDVELTPNGMAA